MDLVTLVAEEIDAMAGELAGRLEVIDAELLDVRRRLERLYEALETSELTLEVLSPRILSLRHREEQLEAAREDAESKLEQRRVELPTTEDIKGYTADFREFLQEGTFPERKALIRNFVEDIEVVGDEAVLTYTFPNSGDKFYHQHSAVELANGNILLFDNGNFRPPAQGGQYSRALELELNTTTDTATKVWEYRHGPSDIFAACCSNVTRLANGNTVLVFGADFAAGTCCRVFTLVEAGAANSVTE